MRKKERYEKVINWFQENVPVAETELHYNDPFELLIAVILSAQCTDKRVDMITPALYHDFPTPEALSASSPEVIFEYIRSVSYPNNKAKHLVGMAKMLVNDFNSQVPDNLEDLVKLPGVGRKTANVIQSVVFNKAAMAVDTHVERVCKRLNLVSKDANVLEVEQELYNIIPKDRLNKTHHQLVLFGRYYCKSIKPKCDTCKLKEICKNLKSAEYYICDLSKREECFALYEKYKNADIDFLVNNAGYGLFGYFDETDMQKELDMIDLNVTAVHILTKLILKDFVKNDRGYILNVASSAGFLAGPYLSTYYATKNYVLKLTMAINEELRKRGSKVSVSALCPGPVDTNFNNVAGGHFNTKSLTSKYVAKYAIDKTLKKKMIIIPSLKIKLGVFFSRFLPYRLLLKIVYRIQVNKQK